MPAPQVTVLMPARNASATVGRSIDSIRRQTYADWELLVVDDGSADETRRLVERIAGLEPRLRLLAVPHLGIAGALNRGLEEAKGSFIARMDADDEAHPDRLGEQATFLQANPGAGLVGCLVAFGGDRSRAGGYALHVDWMNGLISSEEIFLNRFVESPFAHPSVMFRRELVEEHGGYREGPFPEDYELWLRWLEAGVSMAKIPKALLTWNDPQTRLSRRDDRYSLEAFYRCKAGYLARWLRRHVDPARRILVWGAGRPTRKRAERLVDEGVGIAGYLDIDPRKIGRQHRGRLVIGPGDLPTPSECFVLGYVAKRGARELARAQLRTRGYREGRDFLMAA